MNKTGNPSLLFIALPASVSWGKEYKYKTISFSLKR